MQTFDLLIRSADERHETRPHLPIDGRVTVQTAAPTLIDAIGMRTVPIPSAMVTNNFSPI
ncbi:hypothetical protein GCM10023147_49450 [Tsukamurella soli]|uniref:Uncharacterized protein n=1 Tax=Tsukamurella soli TaxID=644556 RepID=A0ABP8KFM5_9ACTN